MAIKHGTTTIDALNWVRTGSATSQKIHAYHNNTWVFDERCIRFYSSSSFKVKLANRGGTASWDGAIQYSSALGWLSYTANNEITATQVTYGNGLSRYEISFRGVGNTHLATENGVTYSSTFTITGTDVYCDGDLLYLLDYNASPSYSAANYTYAYLFYSCTALKSAPKMTLATLPSYCYSYTYYDCTNLTADPTLSYTGFVSGSTNNCQYMFRYCGFRSVTMPVLSTFTNYCYRSMFSGCSSLVSTPSLLPNNSTVTLGSYCFSYMFRDCTSLTDADFTDNLFTTSISTVGNSSSTIGTYSLSYMFYGCTAITFATVVVSPRFTTTWFNIPDLAITTLNSNCYRQMFYNCSSLKFASNTTVTSGGRYSQTYRIPKLGTASGTTTNATYQMLTGTGGTFTGTPTLGTTYYGFVPDA